MQCLSLLDANPFLGSLKRGSFVVVNKNTDGKIIVANYIADEDKDGSQSDKDETHNHSEEEEEHKSVDNVSEAKDDVGKDGSQSDNNDSEEEEEHKSLDNVSEAKDPDDYFDNGEGNKTCL